MSGEPKVLLGRKSAYADCCAAGERVYLTKHSWDCGWYWGFGYLGNKRTHFHIESLVSGGFETNVNKIFSQTRLTQENWWVIRDFFIQAYALKKAAEVYRLGGHQTTKQGLLDMLRSDDKAKALNDDLKRVLDAVWDYVCGATKRLK